MYGNIIDSSVNNVPTAYSTDTGSQLVTNAQASGTLFVLNYTSHVLAITHGTLLQVPSSTPPCNETYVPAAPTGGAGVATFTLNITKGDKIYLRSADGSLASTGKVYWSLI